MKEIFVLALDLGSKTGWAWGDDQGLGRHGMVHFTGAHEERFAAFQEWLYTHSPDVVVFEEVQSRWQSIAAAQVYCGFRGVLLAWAQNDGLRLVRVSPGTLKKFATGKGNATKPEMVAAAQDLTGDCQLTDDNEADAVHLFNYHRSNR